MASHTLLFRSSSISSIRCRSGELFRMLTAGSPKQDQRCLARRLSSSSSSSYVYTPLFESNIYKHGDFSYRQVLGPEAVELVSLPGGQSSSSPHNDHFLKVHPEALTTLSKEAFSDIAHLLRPAHLQQ